MLEPEASILSVFAICARVTLSSWTLARIFAGPEGLHGGGLGSKSRACCRQHLMIDSGYDGLQALLAEFRTKTNRRFDRLDTRLSTAYKPAFRIA